MSFVFFVFVMPTWFFANLVHDALTQSQRRFCRLISLVPLGCIETIKNIVSYGLTKFKLILKYSGLVN